MVEKPSVLARLGCSLLVLALVMFVITLGVIWYFTGMAIELGVNVNISGTDVIPVYFKALFTDQYWKTWVVVLIFMLSATLAAPIMAFVESNDFLLWLKRRS